MQLPLWRQILSQNYTRLDDLIQFLDLNEVQTDQLLRRPAFALNLPRRLAGKMRKGKLDDPLFKQFVPLQAELKMEVGFCGDPVEDVLFRKASKLLHKYQGRILLVTTSVCAMHCRYCFRQNFEYATQNKGFEEEVAVIAQDSSLREVILSGGDPLALTNAQLGELLSSLDKIEHVRSIRLHTRFPIGIPERIDAALLDLLQNFSKQVVVVLHSNHPREFDTEILAALKALRKTGALLLNQSVLLQGVNDNLDTLVELSQLLVDNGILPYYLHQLDRVQGAAHFEVEEERGLQLIAEMRKVLPGYAVPRYVREEAGQPHKTPLAP